MTESDRFQFQNALAELAPQGRTALLPALHAAQKSFGYIPENIAAQISEALAVPLADVYGVIEFFSFFSPRPVAETTLHICSDPACSLAGGEALLEAACHQLGIQLGEDNPGGKYRLLRTTCLGLCDHAPAVLVNDSAFGPIIAGELESVLQGRGSPPVSFIGGSPRRLTMRCGKDRPTSLEEYLASGGYAGLKAALEMQPKEVIDEVKASGLVGCGGAAYPTGLKWEGAYIADGETKYVICNGDESEPGTFKDRILMEDDPHLIIEGVTIAAYAIGAQHGYIYVRGEYLTAYESLKLALESTRQVGLLGKDILGAGFDFDIELRRGAGAYICGEETALFESIEGKRGFPRLKPPFPTTHGLFGKPTVINNVETLCNVPAIIAHGAEAHRHFGTQKSPGTKLFCLSGDVARPGLYEVPLGTSLRYLLFDLAGGVRDNHQLQAILFGGAAGIFGAPDHLDLPLSFEGLRDANLTLGSGVIMVFDESRDLRQVLLQLGRFFAHESCGKCYPCQLGTQRQYEILQRLAAGQLLPGDIERITDVGWTMRDASLCALGQTAASAVLSALDLWPQLFTVKP